MLVEKIVREREHSLIEPIVASLVAADEQDCGSAGIEREQRSERSSRMLSSQFLHVRMSRSLENVCMRAWKLRAELSKEFNAGGHRLLLFTVERFPPDAKLVGILYFPH